MPETWGLLPKSQTDSEKIEEAIARMIQEHNEDETAHLGAGQSLQSHKASEIIDHVVHSVLAEKLHISAKYAEVTVAPTGGDFTDVQSALNAGNKRIFVKAGTYVITSPITILSSDVLIQGESAENTIIKLDSGVNNYVVKVGNGNTALSRIRILNLKIIGQQDESGWAGILFWGGSGKLITNSVISNCVIESSLDSDIRLNYTENSLITGNLMKDYGLSLNYSNYNIIEGNCCYGMGNFGLGSSNDNLIIGNITKGQGDLSSLQIFTSHRNIIIGNFLINSNEYCIDIYQSNYNVIEGNQCYGAYGDGIDLSGSHYNLIQGNQINNNDGDGIHLYNADYNSIIGNRTEGNGGYGINIFNAGCDNNLVVKNYCTGNTSGSINNAGTGTILAASTTNDNVI